MNKCYLCNRLFKLENLVLIKEFMEHSQPICLGCAGRALEKLAEYKDFDLGEELRFLKEQFS